LKKAFILILILSWNLSSTAQCAMCRAVLESEAGQETAKGVNNGIIYLMAIPYILMAGLAFFTYKYIQRISKKKSN